MVKKILRLAAGMQIINLQPERAIVVFSPEMETAGGGVRDVVPDNERGNPAK